MTQIKQAAVTLTMNLQQSLEALRAAGVRFFDRHQAGHVDGKRGLKRRVLEQVRHHQVVVGSGLQRQLDAHIVGGQVLDVDEVRHLAAEDHVANALDELRLVHRVGNAGDVDALPAA